VREALAGGRPRMTVSQWFVSARKRRMWRRHLAAVRSSEREGPVAETVVPAVVVVLVAGFKLLLL
jgi:hypothetical protein